ncbi:MAG: exodeoxyribonuclease III [Bacteroidota bacterium]|nr:exodeoxyribonuclease III [Bacteroidota bacterium]
MKVVSYNINGLRAGIQKGLLEWIKSNDFDVICFQEIKMSSDQADLELFSSLGYLAYWHSAEKKGYSGVLTLSKTKPDAVTIGCNIKHYDSEGRFIRIDFPNWSLLNCYFPSGTTGEERHEFKMKFLKDIYPWMQNLLKEKKNLIVVGDFNIVHLDIDIHNPERKDNPSGFRPEERAWLDGWFKELFDDSFRIISPNVIEFSWWSFRAGSYGKNKGWRIDYQAIAKEISSCVKNYKHHRDIRFSDHCPIEAEYDL